jgi:Protein of unknown function (DUF2778)
MMFSFNTTTGEFKHDNLHLGYGYSGNGVGKNNPEMERISNVGPIPRGRYRIGKPYTDEKLGPIVMHLDPFPETDDFGRSLFRIHGDSIDHPGNASDGCICLGRTLRTIITMSSDDVLDVI